MKKRILAMLMSLMLMIGILPVTALAVDVIGSGECGDNLTWVLDENSTLTISGEGAMWDYSEEYPAWAWYYLENVVIEEGVTYIGSFAFFDQSIGNITIPASVTGFGEMAFQQAYIYGGIWVDEENENFSSDENGIMFNKDKTELIYIHSEVRDTYTVPAKVTKIADFVGGSGISRLVFEGNAPSIGEYAFSFIAAVAFYPENNPTWTEEVLQDYNGFLVWQSYDPENPDFTAYGDCGDSLTWSVDEAGTMTISGEGEMWNYNANAEWSTWIVCANAIKNIVIEEGVTSIGTYAFEGLYDTYNITIPASVKRIGEAAFIDTYIAEGIWVAEDSENYCNDENGILFEKDMELLFRAPNTLSGDYEVPEGVCAIEAYAFRLCIDLTGITFPESLTDIGVNAFEQCWQISGSVNIPASVVVIGEYAFNHCDFVEEYIVDKNNQFYSNDEYGVLYNKDKTELIKALSSLGGTYVIPEGVEVIAGHAFDISSGLRDIEIPNTVTYISEGAFNGCYNISKFTIPESVKFVSDYAFEGCENLRKITFEGDNTTISEFAFNGCWNLSKIIFEGDAPRLFGFDFQWPEVKVYYPEDNATWTENIMTSYGEMAEFVAYDPSEPIPVEIIAEGECGDELTWTLDEDGILTISGEGEMWDADNYEIMSPWNDFSSMIYGVVIEEGVTSIGNCAFEFCWALESISISDTVTSIGINAIDSNHLLKEIYLPASVTEIDYHNFRGESLNAIWVDEENPNYCSDENGVLYNKDKSELLKVPGTYEGEFVVPESVGCIGFVAFDECGYITKVTIPANVEIIPCLFQFCYELTAIVVDKDNENYSSDESGALLNKDMTELLVVPRGLEGQYVIPDGVISIVSWAINGFDRLTSLVIPASVEIIEETAIINSNVLEEIIVDENNKNYSSDAFGVLFNKDKTELIYAPSGLTGEYTVPASVTSIAYDAFDQMENLEKLIFEGNAPESESIYIGAYVTICYPENNPTWTEEAMSRFDGDGIIWESYAPSTRPQGDVNDSGDITNADLVMVARYIVGIRDSETESDIEKYGDMNGDGNVNNTDLISIARIIVGL